MIVRLSLLTAVMLLGACGDATNAAPARSTKGTPMTATKIASCTAKGATLHLAPEALMTRAALNAETLAQRYPATEIKAGDPRLARLTQALRGLAIAPASATSIDPRLLVTIRCDNGDTVTVLGSATGPDGTSHLSINGDLVSTSSAFRRQVEGLADHK